MRSRTRLDDRIGFDDIDLAPAPLGQMTFVGHERANRLASQPRSQTLGQPMDGLRVVSMSLVRTGQIGLIEMMWRGLGHDEIDAHKTFDADARATLDRHHFAIECEAQQSQDRLRIACGNREGEIECDFCLSISTQGDDDPPRRVPATREQGTRMVDELFEEWMQRLDAIDGRVPSLAQRDRLEHFDRRKRFVDASVDLIQAKEDERPESIGQLGPRDALKVGERSQAQMPQRRDDFIGQAQPVQRNAMRFDVHEHGWDDARHRCR